MSDYNYKNGKNRVNAILDNNIEIIEKARLPNEQEFTYDNGYNSWISAVFADIRNSTGFFKAENKSRVARTIRAFTSEVIEILSDDDNLREIGIRGDCVYAIYTTPHQGSIYGVADKCIYVNTFMKMLNKMLEKKNFPTIKVGIGASTAQELVVKAGRKGSGISNNVYIGKAVTYASKLSNYCLKNINQEIAFSKLFYDNMIKEMEKNNPNKNVRSWFTHYNYKDVGEYYACSLIKGVFNKWIDDEV